MFPDLSSRDLRLLIKIFGRTFFFLTNFFLFPFYFFSSTEFLVDAEYVSTSCVVANESSSTWAFMCALGATKFIVVQRSAPLYQ